MGELPELSVQILDIAREHGRITIADTAQATGTIKGHMKALHKNGSIERHGPGRGTWYSLS